MLALIHVFLDNARYHHAKLVQDWLARSECRIKLHFIPSYCPHLNPIERLWASCTETSPTTKPTKPAPNSMRRSISCAKKYPQLGRTLRFGHRQFPCHQSEGFSGGDVNRVYLSAPEKIARASDVGLQTDAGSAGPTGRRSVFVHASDHIGTPAIPSMEQTSRAFARARRWTTATLGPRFSRGPQQLLRSGRAPLLRRPLVDFDVGSPRIGDERDADAAVIHRVGPVKLDVLASSVLMKALRSFTSKPMWSRMRPLVGAWALSALANRSCTPGMSATGASLR
jgi:transposase